jgi:1-phosphatidylinositol-3-phosphate 5-kinase
MLDENLLEFIYKGSSLVTREASKALISMCVYNDAHFLSKHNIMDYSLLVGVDETNQELVVGIIGKYFTLLNSQQ